MKHKIELNDYHWQCGDGCCDEYGTIVTVDGKEGEYHNQDVGTILTQVLQLLDIDFELTEKFDGEVQ